MSLPVETPSIIPGLVTADAAGLLLDSVYEGICCLNPRGEITYLNPAAAHMLQLDPMRDLGRSLHALAHQGRADHLHVSEDACAICRSFQIEQGCHVEHEIFWRPDNTSFPVAYSVSPLRVGETIHGVVLLFFDITRRKIQAQEKLAILASAKFLLWYADIQYIPEKDRLRWFLWPSDEEAAQRFLPFPVAPGQNFAEAFYACRLDEDKERTDAFGHQEVLAGRSYRQEYRCRRLDGEIRWIAEDVQIELIREGRWRAVGACTDITTLKAHEREIEILNQRLQRAMTETHHRVKNNLQIIAALIELQTIDQPESLPLAEFSRLSQHVRTLATVHDILTQEARAQRQADSLSAKVMLDKLVPTIARMPGNQHLHYTVEDAHLSSHQGTSLALITNELVSNATKYGRGDIELTFLAQNGTATLEVCDNGPGFPEGFDPHVAANTGLELVENLTRNDLAGQTCYENRAGGGARVAIVFPLSYAPIA